MWWGLCVSDRGEVQLESEIVHSWLNACKLDTAGSNLQMLKSWVKRSTMQRFSIRYRRKKISSRIWKSLYFDTDGSFVWRMWLRILARAFCNSYIYLVTYCNDSSAASIILINDSQKGKRQMNDIAWHHSIERIYFQIDKKKMKSHT